MQWVDSIVPACQLISNYSKHNLCTIIQYCNHLKRFHVIIYVNLRLHGLNYKTSNHCQAYIIVIAQFRTRRFQSLLYTQPYTQSHRWSGLTPHPLPIASYNIKFIIRCLFILSFWLTMKSTKSHNPYSCSRYFMHRSFSLSLIVYPLFHNINSIVTIVDKP